MLKHIKSIAVAILIIVNILRIDVSSREAYDKEVATALLEERYKPFITLVEDMTLTDDPLKMRVPNYIQSEGDLVKLLSATRSKGDAENLYEDWFIEEEGVLYADARNYYPTIYGPDRAVYDAYIKTRQPIVNKYFFNKDENIEKKLIIRVHAVKNEGIYDKRKYEFKLQEDGSWKRYKADGFSGSSTLEPERNPWWEMWQKNEENQV